MKLVQSLFLPQQATLRKYYAIVTGFDCNPYNGPEAKAAYDAITEIITQRASLNEQMCIRIYDNEPGFGLSRYNTLGNDVEIQIILFSVDANNNGWTVDDLADAFQNAPVPQIMRKEPGEYSFNWYSPTGAPTFQIHIKDDTTDKFRKLDRRHLHVSSERPLNNTVGRFDDYWIVTENNTLTHFHKTANGWENVTEILDSTVGSVLPKPDAKVWFNMIDATVQQITADGWDPERKRVKFATITDDKPPVDKTWLWWTGPRTNLLDWHLYEYNLNSDSWEIAHICACIARDDWTWFYKGKGTTYDVLEDASALGGANLSLNPNTKGGSVEIYRLTTDPSNLVGVADKLVLDATAPEAYLPAGATTNTTVHLRAVAGDTQVTEAVYVTNVRAANPDDSVVCHRTPTGTVDTFESNTSSVLFDVSWIQKPGNFTTLPSINGTQATPVAPGVQAGTIAMNITSGNIIVSYGAVGAKLSAVVRTNINPVTTQQVSYPINTQTAAKNGNIVTLTINTTGAMSDIDITPSPLYTFNKADIVYSSSSISVPLTVSSPNSTESFNVSYRVRATNDFWSTKLTSPTIIIDNLLPELVSVELATPENYTALRAGSVYAARATFKNLTDTVTVSVVTDGNTAGTCSSVVRSGQYVTFNVELTTANGTQAQFSFATTKTSNNSSVTASARLPVVSAAPSLTTTDVINIIPESTKVVTATFDQTVKVRSASVRTPTGVTVLPITSDWNSTQTASVNIPSTVAASLTEYNLTWNVTGPSGIDSSVNQRFTARGFTPVVVRLDPPARTGPIGKTVTDLRKLEVSGKIVYANGGTPWEGIAVTQRDSTATLTGATEYKISADGTQIEIGPRNESLGYVAPNHIEITIEEKD